MIEIPALVGLTVEEAVKKYGDKWKMRVVVEDGVGRMKTNDACNDRLNFTVTEGKIIKVTIG